MLALLSLLSSGAKHIIQGNHGSVISYNDDIRIYISRRVFNRIVQILVVQAESKSGSGYANAVGKRPWMESGVVLMSSNTPAANTVLTAFHMPCICSVVFAQRLELEDAQLQDLSNLT